MTLVEFLLARVVEDEARAEELHNKYDCASVDPMMPFPCDCGEPARVLAECQARRAIIEEGAAAMTAIPADDEVRDEVEYVAQIWEWQVLVPLAQPFKDHPDFLSEWSSD